MGKAGRQVGEDGVSGCQEGGEWILPTSPRPPQSLYDRGTCRCCRGRRLSPHLIPPPVVVSQSCAYEMRVCR